MIINGSVIVEHLDSNDFTLTFISVTKHNCKEENIMIMKDKWFTHRKIYGQNISTKKKNIEARDFSRHVLNLLHTSCIL